VELRAARATRVFNTEKSKGGLGLPFSKIVDCARIRFSSVRNRRSARTGRRPRKLKRHSSKYRPMSAEVG